MKRTVLILGASFSIMAMGFVSLAFAGETTKNVQGVRSHFVTLPNLICIDSTGQAKFCAEYSPFSQLPKVTATFK